MKAVVWHGVGKISVDEVPDPTIQDPTDAIIEITASALCGTDLHFVRGTMSGMVEGTILGHEAVEDHRLGRFHQPARPDRQQVRVAGPGADQGDAAVPSIAREKIGGVFGKHDYFSKFDEF